MKKLLSFTGVLVAMVAPAAARATTVEALPAERFPSYIQVTGTDKPDRVTISIRAGQLFVKGPRMSSGQGCQMSTEREAVCPVADSLNVNTMAGADRVIVEDSVEFVNNGVANFFVLGPGNDFVRSGVGRDSVKGGLGNDRIVGGLGADYLYGGRGADTLNAKDGIEDEEISGGAGRDRCRVDAIDPMAASCTTR